MQHASDRFVSDWKLGVVQKALEARGLEKDFRPIETSPAGSRRRAGFAARRTKKGAMAGFHARGSDVIIEVPQCQLIDPKLRPGMDVAAAIALIGTSRKAPISALVTLSEAGLDVHVTGGKPLDGPLRQDLAQICEAHSLARLSWEDEVVAMRAPPVQRFGRALVVPPPGAFLQATDHGAACLLDGVREIVAGAARVVDLFAGCGTFALPLAENAEIHAVEGDSAMTEALDQGWREASGLKRVTHEARDLFRRPLLPEEMKRFDAAVIDPPRAGAEAQIAELCRAQVARIAHVSCNTVSFARDAQALCAAGFSLDWVQVVDQFRWSPHVELVAQFTR